MALHLSTLGQSALSHEDGRRFSVPGQALLMLAYLCDVGRPVDRKTLATLLWPSNLEAGGTNLRSMLLRLTAATPLSSTPFITSSPTGVAVNRRALDWDVGLIDGLMGSHKLKALADGVASNFLPAVGADRSAIAIWAGDVRARLLSELRAQFFHLLDEPFASEQRGELRRAAVLLLERDPGDDEVRLALGSKLAQRMQIMGTVEGKNPERSSQQVKATASAIHVAPRIALLPPEALDDAERAGSVANAVIEDLTISLCVEQSVSVVAPYTAEQIRSSSDKASLLKQHDVIYALDTKRTGNSLFAQLIFMPRDEIVWATRVQLDDAEITGQRNAIASAIQTSILERVGSHHTVVTDFTCKPKAYFAYLEGLQCLSRLSLPNVRRARKHFKEALEHESGFAAALAGIARTLTMEWVLTARGDGNLLVEAEKLATEAIRDDDQFAGGFKELGVTRLYMGKIDGSLEALFNAERLSPHYADVICSHADSLTHAGNPQAALHKVTAALDLNPLAPDYYYWTAAGASYFVGEYGNAVAYLEKMRDAGPASRLAAASWAMVGNAAKAKAWKQRAMRDNPDFDVDVWLSMIPIKENWQTERYREGLLKAGF